MSKGEPKNVKKLIAKQKPKPKKADQVTVGKRMKLRGGKPKPKGTPTNVLNLIARHLKK